MNRHETLYFIGKCLSLSTSPEKAEKVRAEIRNGKINWELVVEISSGQFVLPALYLNLKKETLLDELPPDLVEYLEYLTNQNRERNQQILKELFAISEKLNKNGISPIFLKGTAHLLLGLYNDIGERMIGDIDFLVADKDMLAAAKILEADDYTPLVAYDPNIHVNTKHYPRLLHKTRYAAVEIHREVLHFPNQKKFGFYDIDSSKIRIEHAQRIYVPSNKNLIIHNTLNTQLNDKAYLKGTINMRQMYDMLLLSNRINPAEVLGSFGKYKKLANTWLAVTHRYFDAPKTIHFQKNITAKILFKRLDLLYSKPRLSRLYVVTVYIYGRITRYMSLLSYIIYDKDERKGLVKRLSNKDYYRTQLKTYTDFFKALKT